MASNVRTNKSAKWENVYSMDQGKFAIYRTPIGVNNYRTVMIQVHHSGTFLEVTDSETGYDLCGYSERFCGAYKNLADHYRNLVNWEF